MGSPRDNSKRDAAFKPIRILIADSVDVMRLGLRAAFDLMPDFEVVADCGDGNTAVKLAARLTPDLIILDADLPLLDGIAAVAQIKSQAPKTLILMCSSYNDRDVVLAALGAGADGFCLKDLGSLKLGNAIKEIVDGERWIDPRLSSKLGTTNGESNRKGSEPLKQIEAELKIIELVEQGASAKEIAKQLRLSDGTVTTIIERMVNKLLVSGEFESSERLSQLQKVPKKLGNGKKAIDFEPDNTKEPSKPGLEAIPAILQTEGAFDGRYRIMSVLGIGGMGIVYKAMHLHMEREVAIKVLHPDSASDPKVIARLKRESKAISALKHPNIVNVHDFGVTEGGQPYLVMDFVEGQPLSDIFENHVPMSAERYADIFIQICDALSATHAKGLVHCDLKPGNIMLQDNGSGKDIVKILDFGLVRFLPQGSTVDLRSTDSFEVTGSPLYMSPEQCNGSTLDPRSDIYSLGCIMYEAFTGKPVFDGATPYKVFSQHFKEAPKPFLVVQPTEPIEDRFEAIVFKALEKDPEDRFGTALELKNALIRCCTAG